MLPITHILVLAAVAQKDNNAYGLHRQIDQDVPGLFVSEQSVYSAIRRLVELRFLEESGTAGHPARYRLSRQGRARLRLEAGRMDFMVKVLRQRL